MSDSVRKIENALEGMKALASKLNALFLMLFIADCLFVAAMLVLGAFRFSAAQAIGFFDVVEFGVSVFDFIVYAAMLLVMRGIARDVAENRSPFTESHAKRIKSIAWLFVIAFVLSCLNSPNFSSVVQVSGLQIGVDSDRLANYPTILLDIKSLIGVIVGFSVSWAWRYGAVLQADSNDYY